MGFIGTGSRKRVQRHMQIISIRLDMVLTSTELSVFTRTETYHKYPHAPIRKVEDLDILPEQLLPNFGITKYGGEQFGLEKAEQVLSIEKRFKYHKSKPASQMKREREQKAKE